MQRHIYQQLTQWKDSVKHKPLIIRGARQVGKTHIITRFGNEFTNFVSINFEKQPQAIDIFAGDLSADRLIRDLQLFTQKQITPGKTLLFLDEIQEAPKAITALRYFYEEAPELHVIAAGSLLDFSLEKIGVPVGRVSFLYLYPLSFLEFLQAKGNSPAVNNILNYNFPEEMTPAVHQELLKQVAEYMAIGGMPEVVQAWCDNQDPNEIGELQQNIIESYQQDFEKYCKKHEIKYVSQIFQYIPFTLGQRFKFSKIPGEYRKRELAPALELLCKAGVATQIYHSDGQGIPLGGQVDLDIFKTTFLDVALAQKILGMHPRDWFLNPEASFINRGEIVESFVAQEILAYSDPKSKANLFYWMRHQKGSSAEVDYLISMQNQVYPIEVKSGPGTSMKSMRMFLDSHKNSASGIRISTHNFSRYDGIDSYPLYAIANLMLQQSDWLL